MEPIKFGARLKYWAWLIVAMFMLLLGKCAHASVTDLKLSTAQIFDVQWYISGSTLNASGFNYIYASINYATQTTSAARWTAAQTADANSNGRYITFVASPTVANTYGMVVKNADGTIYKWINKTGTFRALANGAIFYNGNGMWGTLITTGAGYSYGSSGSWTITQQNPTYSQLEAYTPTNTTPLAAGQTESTGGSSGSTPPPEFCCGGTSAPFSANSGFSSRANSWIGTHAGDNNITINQVGNYNNLTVTQSGRNNGLELSVTGSNNTVNIGQTSNSSTVINYNETTVNGNSNNVIMQQQSTGGSKGIYSLISNNSNAINLQQQDGGSHYAEINLSGGNKTVNLTQSGSANHMAKIELSGGATEINTTQTGSTQQFYSITHNCATASCSAITVTQGQ
jgi:hypothetical protein